MELRFNVETTAHEKDLDTLRQRLAHASYFLYKEGGEPESPAFNPYADTLVRIVAADSRFREIPYARRLPDGGIARIFKNLAPSGRTVGATFVRNRREDPEQFAVDFGGVLALTGISTVTTPEGTAVKFRWRCTRPPDRDYWCFTHLIDPANKIVSQLDHRLLGGEPPLRSWQVGDGGEEEIHLRLPGGVFPTGLQLRFGLYDPPSGERLTISLLPREAASFTLTDRATALLLPNTPSKQ